MVKRSERDTPHRQARGGVVFPTQRLPSPLAAGDSYSVKAPLCALVWLTSKTLVHTGDSQSSFAVFHTMTAAKTFLKKKFSADAPIVIVKLTAVSGEVI